HEDDLGVAHATELLQHFDARLPRHLHVEEYDVRLMATNGDDRLLTVFTFRDDFDVGVLGEHRAQLLPGERLIIDDHALQCHHVPRSASIGRAGTVISTIAPPSAAFSHFTE